MNGKPIISVIMSVYNTEEVFLREAIESILKQTFSDFEFIIVLDCPTDNSKYVVDEYAQKDERIIVINNDTNKGLTKNLNIAIEASSGKYIARMDADDISVPDRFKLQYEYMEKHPDVVVLGARTYTPKTNKTSQSNCVADQDVLSIRMLFGNAGIPHPTAFMRRDVFYKYGIKYSEEIKKSQDYKLWSDVLASKCGKLIMLPEILLMYRVHDNQISIGDPHRKNTFSHMISCNNMSALVGDLSEIEQDYVRTTWTADLPGEDIKMFKAWLDKISASNRNKNIYCQRKLERELNYIWFLKALRRYRKYKKTDMLINRNFKIYKPTFLLYCIKNLINIINYKKSVRKFSQK